MHSINQISLTGKLLDLIAVNPSINDRERAKLHMLDWLGCVLAGSVTKTGHSMAKAGEAGSHPFSFERRRTTEVAFTLGGFGSLLEMDDVHRSAILHPGPVIWPAIISCVTAETAARAPEAALRGYEAMIRLGISVGPEHYANFHNTSTCGGLGSAVAAAWILGLDQEKTQWAMAHALSTSGGVWECRNEVGATKHFHVAEAARRGVQAALVANAGLAGPLRILEGMQGFYAGLAPDGSYLKLLEGAPWAMKDTSFKPWPACRHAHPVIDAALVLRKRGLDRPKRIVIETYSDAVLFCDRAHPTDSNAARFSLQHAVAVALITGPPTLAEFDSNAIEKEEYVAIRNICEVVEDKAMSIAYPDHFGARLSVTVDDSVTKINIPDAWGDTENPMSSLAIKKKFQTLSRWAGIDPTPLEEAIMNSDDGAFALRGLLSKLSPPIIKEE
jgi:2-methylcitrate dehydratase PrpD